MCVLCGAQLVYAPLRPALCKDCTASEVTTHYPLGSLLLGFARGGVYRPAKEHALADEREHSLARYVYALTFLAVQLGEHYHLGRCDSSPDSCLPRICATAVLRFFST